MYSMDGGYENKYYQAINSLYEIFYSIYTVISYFLY